MAENSKIEWTDHTFNPWWGCTKVSAGCKNCYAEARQYGGDWWGKDKPRRFFGEKHWNQPLKWNEKKQVECLICEWRGLKEDWDKDSCCPQCIGGIDYHEIRQRVFCGSYCDVFENRPDLDDERYKLFKLIQETRNLDWLLLTKRPGNVNDMIAFSTGFSDADMWFHTTPHVWLGASIENQKQADIRIPDLLKIPAKVRFLSCEPLLEPIDLMRHWYQWGHDGTHRGIGSPECPRERHHHHDERCRRPFDWTIVGGESGSKARPMNPDWARSIRDWCQEVDIPFFMKQMNKIDTIPDDLFIRQFPEEILGY